MPLTKAESDKVRGLMDMTVKGYDNPFTNEELDLARKVTMGDCILEFGLTPTEANKFLVHVELSDRKNKAVGFRANTVKEGRTLREGPSVEKGIDKDKRVLVDTLYGMKSTPKTKKFKNMAAYEKWADSEDAGNYTVQRVYNESRHSTGPSRLTESRLLKIVLHECSCMMGSHNEAEEIAPAVMKKVIDRIGGGDEGGYHPTPEGDGLRFEDSDAYEESGMIKSNLYSITSKAQSLHDMVQDGDDLPEWVQEKIAVCDEYMDVIHDYLKYEYKTSHGHVEESRRGFKSKR